MAYADKEYGKQKNRERYHKTGENERRKKQKAEQKKKEDQAKQGIPTTLAIEWLRKPLR